MFTASEMAALLWQTQDNPDDVGEYAANQQQRALSGIVTDVLAVFTGLEHICTDTKDDGCVSSPSVSHSESHSLSYHHTP